MKQNQPPISCEEATLITFSRLEVPVIIGSGRAEVVSERDSKLARQLAIAADCEGCIGCRLKAPGRMEPMTEAYNNAVASKSLAEKKQILASRLPKDKIVEEANPNVAA